jgi:hypothetical protein
MDLVMHRATLQEAFVESLGCPLNDTTESANRLRDAFEVVASNLLHLPPVPDKEEYRAAAEKAKKEKAFLADLQSPESKQRREQTKLAFETRERQTVEDQSRWEANQARMADEKRLLGLEGGDRVFNAFATMDGANGNEEVFGFRAEVDEHGYGMGHLLEGVGLLTDAQREQIIVEESLKARAEAMLDVKFGKASTVAPTAFKVKAKDVSAFVVFICVNNIGGVTVLIVLCVLRL